MPAILFVCTGNTCRSPMAEALFRERVRLAGFDLSSWRIESAGTWATPGQPASAGSSWAMAQRGLDLNQHRSQIVSGELLEGFDLILCMELGHKEALIAEFPQVTSRIFMLSQMAGWNLSIADPIGGYLTDYADTAKEIDEWLSKGWETILEKAQNPAR